MSYIKTPTILLNYATKKINFGSIAYNVANKLFEDRINREIEILGKEKIEEFKADAVYLSNLLVRYNICVIL